VAAVIGLATLGLLVASAPGIGMTWDEPFYTSASESYVAWLGELVTQPAQALSPAAIEYFWTPNHEHPPLNKIWSGLVWGLARHVFDDLTAHRLGNMMVASALVALVFYMVASNYGRVAGLASAASLMTLPRFFLHAHLAALDVPVTAAIVFVVFLFSATRDRSGIWWDLAVGVACGVALLTKVNAVIVLPTLLLWVLTVRCRWYLIRRLLVMSLVAPPLYVVLWPWLYHDTVARLQWYVGYQTVSHLQIPQWYMGRLWMPPPWHFPFVITAVVLPLGVLLLAVLGMVRVVRTGRSEPVGLLILLCALAPLLVQTSGRGMVYDDERFFMPAFPYLACLAGVGFAWLLRTVGRWLRGVQPVWKRLVSWGLAGLFFLPQVVVGADLYPHLLSYYSEGVGGLPGAVRRGFETTYWSETYAAAVGYLNDHAPPGAMLWVQWGSHDVLLYYQLQGKLRADLRLVSGAGAMRPFERQGAVPTVASIQDADYVVLQYRQSGFTGDLRAWLNGRKPVYRLSHCGVPLLEIYTR
jgi:4-amino-4-deoxy-L-arabinose transferase-like glycosyltransferase